MGCEVVIGVMDTKLFAEPSNVLSDLCINLTGLSRTHSYLINNRGRTCIRRTMGVVVVSLVSQMNIQNDNCKRLVGGCRLKCEQYQNRKPKIWTFFGVKVYWIFSVPKAKIFSTLNFPPPFIPHPTVDLLNSLQLRSTCLTKRGRKLEWQRIFKIMK